MDTGIGAGLKIKRKIETSETLGDYRVFESFSDFIIKKNAINHAFMKNSQILITLSKTLE